MKPAVIFQSGKYTVTLADCGLIVESTGYQYRHHSRKLRGVLLPSTHPQFKAYSEAFNDLIDKSEGNALCSALF
jgi:hypothetical protein